MPPDQKPDEQPAEGITRRIEFNHGGLDFTETAKELKRWLDRAIEEFIRAFPPPDHDEPNAEESDEDDPEN